MKYISFRKLLSKILDVIERIIIILCICIFGLSTVANGVEIFLRTSGFRSLYWVQEFTVICFIYVTFLGIVVLFKRKGDIIVTFIYNSFRKSIQLITAIIIDVLILLFIFLMIIASYNYLLSSIGGKTATLKIPFIFVYLPLLIGLVFIFIVVIEWLIEDIEHYISGKISNKTL